jgi:hypothetical protein
MTARKPSKTAKPRPAAEKPGKNGRGDITSLVLGKARIKRLGQIKETTGISKSELTRRLIDEYSQDMVTKILAERSAAGASF